MIARKLRFLSENIAARSREDDVFDPTELEQIARALRELLPTVEAMELEPVHRVFRIVQDTAS